jgi:hypothetical protein
LAAYGLSNMLVYGNGPFDIIDKFRKVLTHISAMFGKMLDCMMCTSANVGIIFSIIDLFLIRQYNFTPFNVVFDNTSLWYIIIFLDLCFTSGSVWLLHSLQEYLESFKNGE